MALTEADIQPQMTSRPPGQSPITTPRNEKDRVEILVEQRVRRHLSTPIRLRVLNEDQRPKDHGNAIIDKYPRPSHADWTYLEKYGVKASSDSGRSSAHEIIGRVAAGAIAEKYLRLAYIEIVVVVTSVIRNAPTGLGEPCFDKIEALLAHAMLSIPATKGFEIGSGFGGCEVPGSIHNDPSIPAETAQRLETGADRASLPRPKLTTKTNYSAGIQGGITNGAPIYFRVGFKPPATIGQEQTTATYDGTGEGVLAATTPASCHAPCLWSRLWPPSWSWTRCWHSSRGAWHGACCRHSTPPSGGTARRHREVGRGGRRDDCHMWVDIYYLLCMANQKGPPLVGCG